MKKRIFWIVLILAVVGGGGAWQMKRLKAQAAPKPAGRLVSVSHGDIAVKVSETGSLEPVTQVDVKSRVAGRLLKIFVKEGDVVKEGTLLAIVDPTEVTRESERIKAQLTASMANLAQAKENYALTQKTARLNVDRAMAALKEAQMRLAQTAAPTRTPDLESGKVAVARAEAQVVDAKRTLVRKRSLVAKGFIAQAEADSAQVSVTLAEADVDAAKQRLLLLQAGNRPEDIATARASVESARVALRTEQANTAQISLRARDVERARAEVSQIQNQQAQQDVQLKETRIVAPITGEVVGKFVEEGELIASATAGFAQGAALVKIADLSRMRVRVNVNEVDVARLKTGLSVDIHVDGVPGKTFKGAVDAISPASLEAKTGTASAGGASGNSVVRFEVRIAVVDAGRKLRPGMTASVDIVVNQHKNTLVLPAETLLPGDKVTVVKGLSTAPVKETKTLKIGLRTDSAVEVLSGVSLGDKVEVPDVKADDRRKISFDGPN